jgi:hypothetical protein
MCAVQTRLSCGGGPAELSGSNLNELMGISEGIFRDVLVYDEVSEGRCKEEEVV